MTPSSQGEPLEIRLRTALVGLRPAEGAPSALTVRIDAIPGSGGSTRLAARLGRLLARPAPIALVASAAAMAIAALALANVVIPSGVGSGGAPSATFDPTVEGPGLIRFPIPVLQIAWGLAVLGAIGLARRWRGRLWLDQLADMARGLAVVLIVAVPTMLVIQPPIREYGGSLGAPVGFGPVVNPPPGSDAPEVRYVNAASGQPFIVFFDVTNGSALPMTLNGMVANQDAGTLGARWIALALPSIANTFPNEIQDLRPFTPQVIAPNDRVTLYLVGRAGTCSIGPAFDLEQSAVASYAAMSREVQLGYSVLGLASTMTFTIPMQVVEPEGPPCT